MHAKCYCQLLCLISISILLASSAAAQDLGGKSYYVYTNDSGPNNLDLMSWYFVRTDNETTDAGDNATGAGGLSLSIEGKSFADSSGTYLTTRNFFHGAWDATQSTYSDYYETTITTYYSFFYIGVTLLNDFFIVGFINSSIEETLPVNRLMEYEKMIPFFGILVGASS